MRTAILIGACIIAIAIDSDFATTDKNAIVIYVCTFIFIAWDIVSEIRKRKI